jgi:hypothetical protein
MTKLSEEELQELREITERYRTLVSELGELEINLNASKLQVQQLEQSKEVLFKDYNFIREKSEALSNKLYEKYGSQKVNLDTGEIESLK